MVLSFDFWLSILFMRYGASKCSGSERYSILSILFMRYDYSFATIPGYNEPFNSLYEIPTAYLSNFAIYKDFLSPFQTIEPLPLDLLEGI